MARAKGNKRKFLYGDRVVCVEGDGTAKEGDTGTVIGRPSREPASPMVAVLWDKESPRMHAFGESLRPTPRPRNPIPPGRGWYVYPLMIEKVDEVGEDKKQFGVVEVHGNREG